jgi:cell envelope opacity-associated protein A
MVLPVSDRGAAAVVSGRERTLSSRKAGDRVRFYSRFDHTFLFLFFYVYWE